MGTIRKLGLKILKKINLGTIKIKHHYTKEAFYLDSFMHKGYWYYGKKREKNPMELFNKIIKKGDCIIEMGGHIGYISQYFSYLVGSNGQVIIFEPGENNLPYLKLNTQNRNNVRLEEKAVSDTNGYADFYLENLTGQNNSLLKDYDLFQDNQQYSGLEIERKIVKLETITIDTFLEKNYPNQKIDFVKIDVEGAELQAIKGMKQTMLKYLPSLMIEVTENIKEIFDILTNLDYFIFDPITRKEVTTINRDNIFAIHKSNEKLINELNVIRLN
ncbi:FkbM family methyltransferase [Flavivirga eckloniae]|uniref:FkbM family methyltransferase n=1 Tax=Flavivirga eckloniae TaxID=1803846 RepID=A0A2K9PP77_9FLAO|nr:FkbM family methyltransferase [Flavivirga eckloniae]AUP78846.1 FkbM family methyltransferase [Flavivirga eckloniae]